mmetsp:Transcript_29048/g.78230  ORF Transcript_29048/g.78230 Transcript_29048/m.78230 type:complete len:724 (+) Transcript_29048:54-2225(+)|eukprot:CAMPEP_0202386164 /NCGR_PEP_ID=MMETSP1127-20130417/65053_1 /ASSEMBLY_ACC=CAM_ASM_000462 /TAXON_ID=3047 /ORGANISM="Dunaliella tertiolecta, Strain CCMP1320" /LENGTH=723 /DNA_ID=CAMNT_0048986595 /DNA_START=1354 /DNA_END=3525 /DNA_ORIENTATION=-
MAVPQTKLEMGEVATIWLDYKPLNALHPQLLSSLFENLQRAHQNPTCKAIVVTGGNNNFSPGFDINQFKKQSGSGGGGLDSKINDAFNAYLESGPKPTVAAIQGVALGGGLEVAMACNARVCSSGTRLGLPELQLGIIPGFGGTQRLPRLVGLQKAIEMMLTSQPIKDTEAKERGLIDQVVSKEELLQAAKKMALEVAEAKRPRVLSLYRTDKLEPFGEANMVFEFARAQAAKRARGLSHVLLCLEAIEHGVANGGNAGLKKEAQCFAAAANLDTHKALVHIFFAQRDTKKIKGVTGAGLTPRKMKCVAVLGGGLMGSGIATALVQAGYEVLLKEVNQQFLEGGMQRVRANLQSRVKKGAMSQAAFDNAMSLLKGELTYDNFKRADMVIEAVIEDIPLKQRIFADLEKACRPDCILSTNTSTIDINLVGMKTSAKERILGAHFFSPAHIMPLLEIVRTEQTSKQAILDTLELTARIKKTPVVVGNCTGFAVNRVFFPYTMASCMLVDMGLNPYLVDKAIAGTFGMPMGPFRLNDLVGSDVGFHVGKNFLDSFPDRVYISQLIPMMNQLKRLGEKTGKGFYKFDAKRRASPDPEIVPIIQESQKAAGLLKDPRKPPKMTDEEIIEFIFFPVVNEGCRVVSEGVVDKPADLDVATVMSMGFPAYRGGLIFWADLVGAAKIEAKLSALAQMVGPKHAGFFAPCDYLKQCAQSGRKLSAGVGSASKM